MEGQELIQSLWEATVETFYVVRISTFVAVFGLPLGLLLVLTGSGNVLDSPKLHKVLDAIVNIGRSFPFSDQSAKCISDGGSRWGGGLGNLAIQYGYQRFDVGVMAATIVVLIVLVQLLQFVGDRLAQQFRKR